MKYALALLLCVGVSAHAQGFVDEPTCYSWNGGHKSAGSFSKCNVVQLAPPPPPPAPAPVVLQTQACPPPVILEPAPPKKQRAKPRPKPRPKPIC